MLYALLGRMKLRTLLIITLWLLSSSLAQANARNAIRKKADRASALNSQVLDAMAQKQAASQGAVSRLISSAQRERDPHLHKLAVMALLKNKMPLQRDQKRMILQMVRDPSRGLLPKAPPLPKTGTIEVRHYAMSGFMQPDLAQLKAAGFQVKEVPGGAEAVKGRFHVVVRETHQNILRDLHDTKVHLVVYNGHSQIGGTVEQALLQESMKQPRGRKLISLFQCVGTQTLPLLKGRAPNMDVVTSNAPLYVRETPNLMRALYEGLEQGDGYHRLRRRMEKVASGKGRLVFPNQTASLRHTDFDLNGVLDMYQPPGGIQVMTRKEQQAAKSLLSGVHFLRTMNPYYVEQTPGAVFTASQVKIPVVAAGLSHGAGGQVTQIKEVQANGERRFEVALNPNFSHEPRHVVGAAAVFELQMHLQKTLARKDDPRAKTRALAFVGEYLELIPLKRSQAQTALDRVTALHGMPKLSMWEVSSAIAGDHVIGEKAVAKLQRVVDRACGLSAGAGAGGR